MLNDRSRRAQIAHSRPREHLASDWAPIPDCMSLSLDEQHRLHIIVQLPETPLHPHYALFRGRKPINLAHILPGYNVFINLWYDSTYVKK